MLAKLCLSYRYPMFSFLSEGRAHGVAGVRLRDRMPLLAGEDRGQGVFGVSGVQWLWWGWFG